jgi:macrolide transport system ATP-binding/permease protein
MLQTAMGLVIGIPLALFCVRYIKSVQSQLYEVVGRDAGVIAAALCTMAVAASIAGFIPARRAASTDPAKALRTE